MVHSNDRLGRAAGAFEPARSSPKQPQPRHQRAWYPYYAGYATDFVDNVVSEYASGGPVLDPWNGSGTTTAICARRNTEAVGIDLNPALTVIARARLTPTSIADSLSPLSRKIVGLAETVEVVVADDMLSKWLRGPSVERIRALQTAIHETLCPENEQSSDPAIRADELPLLACFYYTALFATTRDLLRSYRASNPTWVRFPETFRHRVQPSWGTISEMFSERVGSLKNKLSVPPRNHGRAPVIVKTGTANDLKFGDGLFSTCITSPPYATRIDYVKGSLPELAVLGVSEDGIESLRKQMTGTPVVRGKKWKESVLRSEYAASVLDRVKEHPSKGSASYYHPWLTKYFGALEGGLQEIARVVNAEGAICLVVQGSNYKEIEIDLQRMVTEALKEEGRELVRRHDYEVSHHMARINPRARKYVADPKGYESLLVFR